MKIGVLSDTHGLLRPEALERLVGCDRLLHAGDVGSPAVLEALRRVAPVTAVRGNVDVHGPVASLPAEVHEALDPARPGAGSFLMAHRREEVEARLAAWDGAPPPAVALFGHSHRPEMEWWGRGTLLLNPGACGQRRFHLPLTVARLTLVPGSDPAGGSDRWIPEILSIE